VRQRTVNVKDQAGFVVNALLFPYLNNAIRLLEQGVATKEGIDIAMKGGCGFPMGPFALLDLVGLDTSLAILDALFAEFAEPNFSPRPLLRRMVSAGQLGRKSGSASTTTVAREIEEGEMAQRSKPWVMRTYSGHSSAVASNKLYRSNLAKGQTGLSIAFDLPTQTGYDRTTRRRRRGRKVGVPIAHLGHMRQLFEGLPLDEMNTSMTINATARGCGVSIWRWPRRRRRSQSTAGHDAERHREGVPLARHIHLRARTSKRLIVDMIAYGHDHVAKWNPINVCSYHLQEAGATPVQEIAYSLATAIDVLDAVRDSGKIPPSQMPHVVGQISFFVNAGVRFIEEIAKMRTFTAMWDEICRTRYGVEDATLRRFRYGVQVNSLGLTEHSPRTTCSASCSRCLASRFRPTREHARCNCRRGTKRSVSRAPPTSSGACGCSRCSPSRVTSSSIPTSSPAPR